MKPAPVIQIVGDTDTAKQMVRWLRCSGIKRVAHCSPSTYFAQAEFAQANQVYPINCVDVVAFDESCKIYQKTTTDHAKQLPTGSIGASIAHNRITFWHSDSMVGEFLLNDMPPHIEPNPRHSLPNTPAAKRPKSKTPATPNPQKDDANVIRPVFGSSIRPCASDAMTSTATTYQERKTIPASLTALASRIVGIAELCRLEREVLRRNESMRSWNQCPGYAVPDFPSDIQANILAVGVNSQLLVLMHSLGNKGSIVSVPTGALAEAYLERERFDAVVVFPLQSKSHGIRFCTKMRRNADYASLPFFLLVEDLNSIAISPLQTGNSIIPVTKADMNDDSFVPRLLVAAIEHRYQALLQDSLTKTRIKGVQDPDSGMFDSCFAEQYTEALCRDGVKTSIVSVSVSHDIQEFSEKSIEFAELQELITSTIVESLPHAALCCNPSTGNYIVILPEFEAAAANAELVRLCSALRRIEVINPTNQEPAQVVIRGESGIAGAHCSPHTAFENARSADYFGKI